MATGNSGVLLVLLLAELLFFGLLAGNFATAGNAAEILRLGSEIGLLALALTAVIVTGGIDLSVGSLMGLCAVLFGMLVKERGLPWPAAAAIVACVGAAGGLLNGGIIAKLNALPLIVTLGTYSLFRGIAEGLTGGVRNYTGFTDSLIQFGRGWQGLVLIGFIAFWYALLHRGTVGRALYAIGCSPQAARASGLPVGSRLMLIYGLTGFSAGLAGIVYVARVGQARSDAGTGYELLAITAVVLGGTSINGGRGGIAGTLLGLGVITILQNGLRLAGYPAELGGILTGLALLLVIALGNRSRKLALILAPIAAAVLIGIGIAHTGGSHRITVAMMPKAKGDPYFVSCRAGAEQAAREAGVDLLWDGPTDLDPARQNEIVESWITRGVDVIAVSVENRDALSSVLRKARANGIGVLTWDADADPDARDFFINQATPEGIGSTLADEAAKLLGGKGEYAIVTASLTAANQNEWIAFIKKRMAEKYPAIKLATIRPSDGDRDRAFAETQTILKVYPNVRAIVTIAAPSVPGSAEAVRQSGRGDVGVTGLSLPNLCKPYIHSGAIQSIVLWNTTDLGYLTVLAAKALKTGALQPGTKEFNAGRLGRITVRGSELILGAPFIFTAANVDRFNF